MTWTQAYSINAEGVSREMQRCNTDAESVDISRVLELEDVKLPDLGPRDVRMKVLAVSAEHNIAHAATADTGNIAQTRGGKIYPGNSAVGEVVEVGSSVAKVSVGDIVLTHCNGHPDRHGYPLRIWAYDQPNSVGWYSQEAVVGDWQVIRAPLGCGLSLWEIAALPLRAPTAYHLYRRAIGIFRLKVAREKMAKLNVLSFGGGVGELFLMLARSEGHNAFYCAGNATRREALEESGIVGVDQNTFNRFAARDDTTAFARECKRLTSGDGMHLVCDMLRGPVFGAGLAAASRCGVNVSAGWQLSRTATYNTTVQSVKQVTIDHMHYETVDGCAAATKLYGDVFKPVIHREVYEFNDLPRCMKEMHQNIQTGIAIVRVARVLPTAVQALA